MKLIPGEKKLLKAKENELGRRLTKTERIAEHKKAKRKFIIGTILGLGGTLAVAGGVKALGEAKQEKNNTQSEQEAYDNLNIDFNKKYAVEVEPLDLKKIQETDIEKEVEQIENKEELLRYIKNIYIENYEKQTGDTTLTTADIKIRPAYEDYIFIDDNTKEMITHGEQPYETMDNLQENNISYSSNNEGIKVYKVFGKDDNIIDCITLKTQDKEQVPVRMIPGNQFNDMKDYKSVFVEMGPDMCNAIIKGLDYHNDYENSNKSETSKKEFIQALEKAQEDKQQDMEEERE